MKFSHIAGWMENGSMFSNNFQFLIHWKKKKQENPFLGLLDYLFLVYNNILLKDFSLELLSPFFYIQIFSFYFLKSTSNSIHSKFLILFLKILNLLS